MRISRVTAFTIVTFTMIGCGSKESPTPTAPTPPTTVVTATLLNRLDIPVAITSGTATYGSLVGGQSTSLTLPPGTKTVSWTSSKRRFSDGSSIQDDLSGTTLSLSTNLNTLDINNVVDGVTYFSPVIQKEFADTLSLELVSSTGTRCIGWQSGNSYTSFSWGYYRFDSSTILRYYRGSRCGVGSTRGWNNSILLSSLAIGSGVARLRADVLP